MSTHFMVGPGAPDRAQLCLPLNMRLQRLPRTQGREPPDDDREVMSFCDLHQLLESRLNRFA